MRNLFKKSLTLCLVAILAFSCFAGIVSAENSFTATIAVENQTITPGTTSVDVVLDITSSEVGINEALIEVSSDIGTIGSKAELVSSTGAASIQMPEGSTNYGSFYLSAENDISGETTVLGSVTAAQIKVTFTVAEDKAVGTYPINIAVDGVRAASSDEDVISFSYDTANVTVAEPHVHEYTYTPNGDKTHNGTCTCGEDAISNEACVDGDDEDSLCDKCNFDLAEEDVCEHENATSVVTTQPTKDAVGVMTYTCECGHSWTEDIAIPAAITTVPFGVDPLIEDKVKVRLRIPTNMLTDAGYDDFYVAMEYEMYDTADGWIKKVQTDTLTYAEDFAELTSPVYYHTFAYQAMYEINLPLKATAYFMTDGVVTAYRDIIDSTLAQLLLGKFPGMAEKNLKMNMDLINYATAVQTNFAANGDVGLADSIDKDFVDYQYAASTTTEFTFTNPYFDRPTVTGVQIAADYIIGASNNIRYRAMIDTAKYDISKVQLQVSYHDSYYDKDVETPKMDAASLDFLGSSGTNNVYSYMFAQLALYDFNQTVTATIYYDGDELYTAEYCLEYDVYNSLVQTDAEGNTNPNYKVTTENVKNVYITAMRLAESSRAAFNLN